MDILSERERITQRQLVQPIYIYTPVFFSFLQYPSECQGVRALSMADSVCRITDRHFYNDDPHNLTLSSCPLLGTLTRPLDDITIVFE